MFTCRFYVDCFVCKEEFIVEMNTYSKKVETKCYHEIVSYKNIFNKTKKKHIWKCEKCIENE